jgi:lipopolysaccharide transport system ATP-binding protein
MSSDVVIRAEGLGKKYIIGHQAERERYTTLRDSMGRSLKNWGRSARDMFAGEALVAGDETEEFWALKDINFEIKRGDVVGIIGRNGAGKSTLLKVLSRITEPTTGRVTIDGRVASLLEVGTGFHPELSGRENIYLNGAILGMSRDEIRRKFDEIVDFAGVEKFLDTPVKRYSSGMYVRLAFAVAAHLEPEILIVDEVLAVGDAEFQKKCLGKMKDVAGHGRTVLFVSHNMAAVRSLCSSSILLKAGRLEATGSAESMIELHGRRATDKRPTRLEDADHRTLRIKSISVSITDPISIALKIELRIPEAADVELRCLVRTQMGANVGIGSVGGFGAAPLKLRAGLHNVCFELSVTNLAGDHYHLDVEMVSSLTGKVMAADAVEHVDFAPAPASGDVVYLRGEWAAGHIRFPSVCTIESVVASLVRRDAKGSENVATEAVR